MRNHIPNFQMRKGVRVIIRESVRAFIRVYDNAYVVVRNQSGYRSFAAYNKGSKTAVTVSGDVLVRGAEM